LVVLCCLRAFVFLLPEWFPTSPSGSPWGGGEIGNHAGSAQRVRVIVGNWARARRWVVRARRLVS
jgi:hypothetical protein